MQRKLILSNQLIAAINTNGIIIEIKIAYFLHSHSVALRNKIFSTVVFCLPDARSSNAMKFKVISSYDLTMHRFLSS